MNSPLLQPTIIFPGKKGKKACPASESGNNADGNDPIILPPGTDVQQHPGDALRYYQVLKLYHIVIWSLISKLCWDRGGVTYELCSLVIFPINTHHSEEGKKTVTLSKPFKILYVCPHPFSWFMRCLNLFFAQLVSRYCHPQMKNTSRYQMHNSYMFQMDKRWQVTLYFTCSGHATRRYEVLSG